MGQRVGRETVESAGGSGHGKQRGRRKEEAGNVSKSFMIRFVPPLLPASCFLLPASCFLLPASCFLLPISFLSQSPHSPSEPPPAPFRAQARCAPGGPVAAFRSDLPNPSTDRVPGPSRCRFGRGFHACGCTPSPGPVDRRSPRAIR